MAPETTKRFSAEKVANMCNSIEGVPVSERAKELSRQWVLGAISGEDMIRALVAQHKKNT